MYPYIWEKLYMNPEMVQIIVYKLCTNYVQIMLQGESEDKIYQSRTTGVQLNILTGPIFVVLA